MASPTINYTSRDFDSIVAALKLHLQAKFPTTWRDFYEAGSGMALLELIAYTFDILSYYLDVQANEVYLETARDRENILKIASLVGYKLSTPSPAAVSIDASIPSSESVDVIIREGTQITSAEGVKFEFLSDQVILAGQTTASLLATQGETKSDSFVSDGSSFQKQTLVNTPVIQDTIEAIVGGVLWSEVSSLAYAVADDKVFAVTYDVDDKAHISFGDGTNGKIPPNGETVVVNYRIGGGLVGNIALSEINTNVQGEKDGSSPIEYVTVSLINATYRGTGGADRETIDHAKLWIPRWIRCNNRAVTEYDFDTLASLFSDPTYGSVGWAKSKLRQEIPELNTVDVYIYVRDVNGNPTTPSAGLISALQAYFDNNDGEDAVRIISVDVVVQVGNLVYIDIDASVSPDTGYAFATVKTNVGAAITSLMTGSNIQPGSDFNISKLYESIQNALGVSHAIVNQITASYRTNESLGTGTGAQTQFTKTLVNLPLTPHNVLITTGSLVVTDDGEGNLTGDVDPTGNNTVDYLTGDIDVTFSTPPAGSADVNCQYDYILYYQRGAEEAVSTGAARFTGSLPYHPVVPGSLAFSDGVQTVTDDSNGNLIGDVYATGTIDYDTGYYDFTFLTAPVAGTKLYSTYQQRLKTSSLDLPIGKDQIAVENRVDISTL